MVRTTTGKHPKYFEAILQLRECSQEIVTFVESEMKKLHLGISQKKRSKHGMDYYLSDTNLTQKLTKRLNQKFTGQLKVSATLHTRKNNKDLYRTTFCFREAQFGKDDIVTFNGDEYVVLWVNKDIFLRNTTSGEKIHLKLKEMKNIRKVE